MTFRRHVTITVSNANIWHVVTETSCFSIATFYSEMFFKTFHYYKSWLFLSINMYYIDFSFNRIKVRTTCGIYSKCWMFPSQFLLVMYSFLSIQCHKEYSEACSKLAKLQSTGAEAAKVLRDFEGCCLVLFSFFNMLLKDRLIVDFIVWFLFLARTCSDTVPQYTQCVRTSA